MGRLAGQNRVVFKRKLFDGRRTAEEEFRRLAFPPGATCAVCSSPKVAIQIVLFAELSELEKRDPGGMAALAATNPQGLHALLVPTRYGVTFIRLKVAHACDRCKVTAERAAAKHPSWMYVDIKRGPGPDKIVIAPNTDAPPFAGG